MRLAFRVVVLLLVCLFAACRGRKPVQTLDKQLPGPILSTLVGPTYVEVEFSGIISHVRSGSTRRAILVADASHKPRLTVASVYKTAIENVTGRTCTPHLSYAQCTVDIKGLVLRIVSSDASVPRPAPFALTDFTADPTIPHLGDFGVNSLHTDVLDDFPDEANTPVASWFSLNGGEAKPQPFICKGSFPSQPPRRFNKWVTLILSTREKAELQIKTSKNAQWESIRLEARRVFFRVSNDPDDPTKPHFHLFGKLNDPPIANFPEVTPEQYCTEGVGTVPGCSNSTWP